MKWKLVKEVCRSFLDVSSNCLYRERVSLLHHWDLDHRRTRMLPKAQNTTKLGFLKTCERRRLHFKALKYIDNKYIVKDGDVPYNTNTINILWKHIVILFTNSLEKAHIFERIPSVRHGIASKGAILLLRRF